MEKEDKTKKLLLQAIHALSRNDFKNLKSYEIRLIDNDERVIVISNEFLKD